LRLLEEALVAFQGSVIVVSHDRYFLNRICTAILAFESDGAVRYHVGNYDYYLEKRALAQPAVVSDSPLGRDDLPVREAAGSNAVKPRKLKWKEERELETIESDIHAAEGEVGRLEALLASPDFAARSAAPWQATTLELAQARERVTQLYARWAELESLKSR
jgi:ATP-binding cassette subfamily F protein uup